MKAIISNIKMLRLKNKWTQKYMSARLGISHVAYSKLEGGFVDISISRVEQIAGIYGMSAVQLLTLGGQDFEQEILDQIEAGRSRILELEKDIPRLQQLAIELMEELRYQQEPVNEMSLQAAMG